MIVKKLNALKVMGLITIMFALPSCLKSEPKYKEDTCFKEGFTIAQITEVTKTSYIVKFYALFLEKERTFEHEIFENEVSRKGLVPKSCDEFRKKKEETE